MPKTLQSLALALLVGLTVVFPMAGCRKDEPAEPPAPPPEPVPAPTLPTPPTATAPTPPTPTPTTTPGTRPARPVGPATRPAMTRPTTIQTAPPEPTLADLYEAVQRDPQDLDALEQLAERLAEAGDHEAVVSVYRAIIATAGADSPRGRTARFNLAVALLRLQQLVEAEDELLRLLSADPTDARARFNLAAIYRSQGRLTDAKAHLQAVTAQGNALPDAQLGAAYGLLGKVLGDLRDSSGALAAHAKAVRLRPRATDAWLAYAGAARTAGRYGTALMALEQARGLTPGRADILARIGTALLVMHEATGAPDLRPKALEALRQSLAIDPDQPDLQALLDEHAEGE